MPRDKFAVEILHQFTSREVIEVPTNSKVMRYFDIVFFIVYLSGLNIIKSSGTKLEVQKNSDSDVAHQQLQQIYKQTKHMKYGQCWTDAVIQLENGCRQLTDEVQRRIAYAFARCHLQSAGRDIPICSERQLVEECTNEEVLKDSAFNTYTEFFTHTQQICFHLQSQIWHESTEVTISKLADNSAEVATSLEASSHLALEMVERQNRSLHNQEELLRNERLLRENMHRSVLDVQKSHEETKSVINEQKALFAEVFDRVSALQKTMLGEFTSLYTFGFYVGTAILAYILTSTPRSSSARFWLFVLITLNFFTERAIVSYHLAPASHERTMYIDNSVLPETIYKDMWLCRKVYCLVALLVVIVCIVRYKDYGKINNTLLNEIKRQNTELQGLLREHGATFQSFNSVGTPQKPPQCAPGSTDLALISPTVQIGGDIVPESLVPKNTFEDANDVSLMTVYNSDNDSTFIALNESTRSSESSFSSYLTTDSRRSSISRLDTTSAHSFVRSSTPSRRSLSRRSSVTSTASFSERLDESVLETEGVIIGGYNLRRRHQSVRRSSGVGGESVESFMKSVAKVTLKRKNLLQT